MFSSIDILGYRGFDSFRLSGLGNVNLLVGANNCGKTSILECIELLQSGGSPDVLNSILSRRGELDPRMLPVIRHLFADHDVVHGGLIVAGKEGDRGVPRRISLYSKDSERDVLLPTGDGRPEHGELEELTPYALHIDSPELAEPLQTKMTSAGALPELRLIRPWRSARPVRFLRTEGMTPSDIGQCLSEIILTEREKHVVDALKVVEPAIVRIAPVTFEKPALAPLARSGVFVKLKNVEERVPIGSLGDGLWRMLGLALALANCRGGVLLVDEIDTGLHYTVMEDMWRMVSERAAALSVQVFATTHSRDCWESLGAIARPELISSGEITIQRIDRQRREGVRFDKDAIMAAAKRGLEVR